MRTILRVLRTFLLSTVALAAAIYLGDFLSLRFQIPGNRPQFGTVTVRSYLAVPLKNGKTEFIRGDTVDQNCVYSLFPHFGNSPCWYLERHKTQRENL